MIFGYTRVSTVEQAEGTSLETQRQQIQGFAMMRGEKDVDFNEDAGVSGSLPLQDREAGFSLLLNADKGDTIVAAKLDRMFRDTSDALAVAKVLEERGIDLVLLDMGTDPVNKGGVGKLVFTLLAALAEMERTRIAERVAAGKAAKKARGGAASGTAPFGWTIQGRGKEAVLVKEPEAQKALQTIRQAKEAGLSLRDISRVVEEVHGLKVSHVAVDRIVKEKRYGDV